MAERRGVLAGIDTHSRGLRGGGHGTRSVVSPSVSGPVNPACFDRHRARGCALQ